MSSISTLSDKDFSCWLNALKQRPAVGDDFLTWIEGPVRAFFPFKRLFLAHGELLAGQIRITDWRAIGHEPRYLQQLCKTFDLRLRGSLAQWLNCSQPFVIDPDCPGPHVSQFELTEIRTFGLESVGAHGIVNLRANAGTYFSFSGLSTPVGEWHLDALRLMVPVLSDLFLLAVGHGSNALRRGLGSLTTRQVEIARLVAAGLCNKSIAKTLHIEEKTVRNQLTTVYATFGVRSRAELGALLR